MMGLMEERAGWKVFAKEDVYTEYYDERKS